MTSASDNPPLFATPHLPERSTTDSPAHAKLRARVATALRARTSDIAVRWEEQSRTVALREPRQEAAGEMSTAAALVDCLAVALASDGATSDDLIARGLTFGVEAFGLGESLQHVLKGLDLLSAMILYAVELDLADESAVTAGDGVRVSRRLQQASSLLTLAATKGYMQAMGAAMRDQFRHLRHDLRNPLGTIKNVLAIMDDETMPAEARTHPRFRAMAKRNARTLGELIADRLSDAEAVVPALVRQSVPLRTIASGVRRDLRAEAEAKAVTVVIGEGRAPVMVDAVGLELVLYELILALLQEAPTGSEITIEFADIRENQTAVTLQCAPMRRLVPDVATAARLTLLSSRMSTELTIGDQALTLLVPVRRDRTMVVLPELMPSAPISIMTD